MIDGWLVVETVVERDVRRILSLNPSSRTSDELDKLEAVMMRELSSFREFPVHMHRALVRVVTYAQ